MCLPFAVVSAGGDGVVPVDLHHRQHLLVHCLPGHPVMGAGINAWFQSALSVPVFHPGALGAAYYLAPKVTGRPVQLSAGETRLLVAGGHRAVGRHAEARRRADSVFPALPRSDGRNRWSAIPADHGGGQRARDRGRPWQDRSPHSPSLRFTMAGMVGLLLLAAGNVLLFLPGSTLHAHPVQLAGYGYEILALYGFFSLIMFGAIYFLVPRITRREWLSRRLISCISCSRSMAGWRSWCSRSSAA